MHYIFKIILTTYFLLGGVCYQVFDYDNIADQPPLDELNHFIKKKYNVSFNGVWMVVVEWRQIHAYPHSFATRFPNLYTDASRILLNKVKLWISKSSPLIFLYDLFFYRQTHFRL